MATQSIPTVSKPTHLAGELEFGSDPIGGGHHHRVAVSVGCLEEAREAADGRKDLGPVRSAHDFLDVIDEGFIVIKVHASSRIGGRRFFGFIGHEAVG